MKKMEDSKNNFEKATLGGGCFWCTEAVYQDIKGVESVVSGYSGGHIKNPAYREVCSGRTGHAEVIQITFNSEIISYEEILEIFWHVHDPTTLNQQGNDVGTQYRSVIYYHNETQKEIAENSKIETDASNLWSNPIVTEISPFDVFYAAENYHQNYYKNNALQPYCTFVITPKMQKLRKKFSNKLVNI